MLEIERAGVKDHGVVTRLLLEFAREEGWEPEADRDRWDRVIAELLDSDRWLFLLAYEEGDPVGLAVVHYSLTLYGSREEARLVTLIVDEEQRRKGIGSRLVEEVLAAAQRRGCRELLARITGEQEIGGLYEKFGFTGERKLFVRRCDG